MNQEDWQRIAMEYEQHVRECHALMQDELDGILHSACPLVSGIPDRSQLDKEWVKDVERYERLLAWKATNWSRMLRPQDER